MVDNEKRDNLANARRKLKKFRDQQNGNDHSTFISETNGTGAHSINGISSESVINYNNASRSVPYDLNNFVDEQQAILNGIHVNLSKSPILELEEQNRQYVLLIENQKQQRARLEDQRPFGGGSSMSGRSSQTQPDGDLVRQIEQKYRRELEHLQEQLEIHVQTIGILVAEKTDISAKFTQSVKQLERRQSEMDEVQGRLKASRERVEELEKHNQNTTSTVQKRDMAAKESDKEIDRLKTETNRQNQTIEDLKQNLNEINEKFLHRQTHLDQLNNENTRLKQKLDQSDIRLQQFQSMNAGSTTDIYEQQMEELQKSISAKTNETEVLLSTINQMRSEHDQMQSQYQQYNANVQRHIQELNEQINQLVQTNNMLENEREAMRKAYEMKLTETQHDQTTQNTDLTVECDSLRQENELFKIAIDQWSKQFEQLRIINEELTKQITEKDEQLSLLQEPKVDVQENTIDHSKLLQTMQEDKTTLSRAIGQNKQLKDQLTELQDGFIKISNDNMKLTNQIQAQEYLNKQLNDRLLQKESSPTTNVDTTEQSSHDGENTSQRLNELVEENQSLRERLLQIEEQSQFPPASDIQVNESSSLSSLDDTPQLPNEFVEKVIVRFNRAMRDNADLQDRTQQLEHLTLQLQSETDTIGDYISLYQQQRQQLHRRYQEKDDYIKQLTHDRLSLQRKLSELESLLMRGLNKPSTAITEQQTTNRDETTSSNEQQTTDENEWPEMVDNGLSSSEQTTPLSQNDQTTTLPSIPSLLDFDDETKTRILTLLKELGQTNTSTAQTDHSPTTKLAFIGKNLYVCSTCTGPVQWV